MQKKMILAAGLALALLTGCTQAPTEEPITAESTSVSLETYKNQPLTFAGTESIEGENVDGKTLMELNERYIDTELTLGDTTVKLEGPSGTIAEDVYEISSANPSEAIIKADPSKEGLSDGFFATSEKIEATDTGVVVYPKTGSAQAQVKYHFDAE